MVVTPDTVSWMEVIYTHTQEKKGGGGPRRRPSSNPTIVPWGLDPRRRHRSSLFQFLEAGGGILFLVHAIW